MMFEQMATEGTMGGVKSTVDICWLKLHFWVNDQSIPFSATVGDGKIHGSGLVKYQVDLLMVVIFW